ncbi:MAG: hypothetical protein U0168_30375 [Nannocystaceae bacterium]
MLDDDNRQIDEAANNSKVEFVGAGPRSYGVSFDHGTRTNWRFV